MMIYRGIGVPQRDLTANSGPGQLVELLHRGGRGLGRSWARDPGSAQLVALDNSGRYLGDRQLVPVLITAEWDGDGQDLSGSGEYQDHRDAQGAVRTSVDWPDGEVPLLPGTAVRILGIRIQRVPAGEWESALDSPADGCA